MATIVLASASPRRQMLLRGLGIVFEVVVSGVDEEAVGPMPVTALVRELAVRKARAVARERNDGLVIGADTSVAVDGVILGKPDDPETAKRMLSVLRGRRHSVATGVVVVDAASGTVGTEVALTRVTMRRVSDAEIDAYIATGEPLDKAGAYGIQGLGGRLISAVEGRVDTAIGLPCDAVVRLLSLGSDAADWPLPFGVDGSTGRPRKRSVARGRA